VKAFNEGQRKGAIFGFVVTISLKWCKFGPKLLLIVIN